MNPATALTVLKAENEEGSVNYEDVCMHTYYTC